MSLDPNQFTPDETAPQIEEHLTCVEFSVDNDIVFSSDGSKRGRLLVRAAHELHLLLPLVSCERYSPEGEEHALLTAYLTVPHVGNSSELASTELIYGLLNALDAEKIGSDNATLYHAWDAEMIKNRPYWGPSQIPALLSLSPIFRNMDELVFDINEQRTFFSQKVAPEDFNF